MIRKFDVGCHFSMTNYQEIELKFRAFLSGCRYNRRERLGFFSSSSLRLPRFRSSHPSPLLAQPQPPDKNRRPMNQNHRNNFTKSKFEEQDEQKRNSTNLVLSFGRRTMERGWQWAGGVGQGGEDEES